MPISASFAVNSNSAIQVHSTSYGATVNLALDSLTSVRSIAWSIEGTSHSSMTKPTITLSGSPTGSTASFAMPSDPGDGEGRTVVVKCIVTDASRSSAVAYRVVSVANSNGQYPIAVGEENYRNATHGWTETFNAALAQSGGGGGSSGTPVALTDANVTITVSQGVLRRMSAGTQTTNRTVTLGYTGAIAADTITIQFLDGGAYTLAVVDEASGETINTFTAGVDAGIEYYFDGTFWAALRAVEVS